MRTTFLGALAVTLLTGLVSLPAGASAQPAAVPTCDGKPATIVVPSSKEWPRPEVVGTPGNDVIVGSELADRIDGGEGDDTVCGLDGADQIVGGPGDDRLFGDGDGSFPGDDYWGDVIQPGAGNDYVDLGDDFGPGVSPDADYSQVVSYADAPGPVHVDLGALVATGHGTDTFASTPPGKFAGIVGSPFADVLIGGPADDGIYGGGGDDVIRGGPGDDDLDGDLTSDLAIDPGKDTTRTTAGRDVVHGGHGDDSLAGAGDELLGEDGQDVLAPGPGSMAHGGQGDDLLRVWLHRVERRDEARTLVGGGGRDRVMLGRPRESGPDRRLLIDVPKRSVRQDGRIWGILRGAEEFVVHAGGSSEIVTFRGGAGPELFRVMHAENLRVRVFGGGGADVLHGYYGADLLVGGPGRDRLHGHSGRDRCVAGERLHSCERHG